MTVQRDDGIGVQYIDYCTQINTMQRIHIRSLHARHVGYLSLLSQKKPHNHEDFTLSSGLHNRCDVCMCVHVLMVCLSLCVIVSLFVFCLCVRRYVRPSVCLSVAIFTEHIRYPVIYLSPSRHLYYVIYAHVYYCLSQETVKITCSITSSEIAKSVSERGCRRLTCGDLLLSINT